MYSIGGLAGGIGIGNVMTNLKEMKSGSPFEKVHHWVTGLIVSIIGILAGALGYFKSASLFLTSIGFGIMLTDLKDMGKQLDNIRDSDPITEGVANPPYNEFNGSDFINIDS